LRSPKRKRARHELHDSPSTESDIEEGHTPRVNFPNPCSACQSLLIRPNCNPETQRGAILTDLQNCLWRSPSQIKHAMSLCFLCTLLMAALETIGQHSATGEISAFEMALSWSTKGRFYNIDVIPRNKNNELAWNSQRHQACTRRRYYSQTIPSELEVDV